MPKDSRKQRGARETATPTRERAWQPAPGKVTRSSRLPAGRKPAAQRKVDPSGAPARGRHVRSLAEWTRDPWIDAAHRGTPLPPDARQDPVQASGGVDAGGGQERAERAGAAAPGAGGSGEAMPEQLRVQMEDAFGADFSAVRVHEGPEAPSIGALAYTQGTDIHFAPGQYDPSGQRGQELLGHELAHVVQQAQGRVTATTQAQGVPVNDDAALEREADVMGARAARGQRAGAGVAAGALAPGRTVRQGRAVQRFMSEEHQSLGNQATGDRAVNAGGEQRFDLSHGDIVALSGDWFAPDDLFRLAAIPGDRGRRVDTRDEILCALKIMTENEGYTDARFESGGTWADYTFPDAVRDAVNTRYRELAGQNTNHFVAPRGRGSSGDPIPDPDSGGSYYRNYHEVALLTAYRAGCEGGDVSHAVAREAAAQHWLTDAFASGHSRTPVGSIREHWQNTYPLFWYNLRHKMALDTAIEMNERADNLTGALGTVQMMYEAISEQIETMAGSLPSVGLGDLLAKVFHDYDNEHGLAIEGGGRIYGDSHLDESDPQNRTRALAEAAIRAGVEDVEIAFRIGQGGSELGNDALFAQVRAESGASGAKYRPEEMIPTPDQSTNEPQNWQAASFEALWNQHLLGSSGPTVGEVITEMLQPGGEIHRELSSLAEEFPEVEERWSGDLEPRQAFQSGFLEPLCSDPHAQILAVINWAPNYGLGSSDRDDISLATGAELDEQGMLDGMTTEARAAYVRELIDGSCDADDEGELVVRIFETAPASERRRIYQIVEGHAWNGDWIQGWTVTDDDIWDALSTEQLEELRDIIDG